MKLKEIEKERDRMTLFLLVVEIGRHRITLPFQIYCMIEVLYGVSRWTKDLWGKIKGSRPNIRPLDNIYAGMRVYILLFLSIPTWYFEHIGAFTC
jgi:hypothetical protein